MIKLNDKDKQVIEVLTKRYIKRINLWLKMLGLPFECRIVRKGT